jgi:CubicO group peptidase (beta-lactamase class C family)
MINVLTFFLFFLLLGIPSFGQSPPIVSQGKNPINKIALVQKLDSLFSSFNKNTPGVAVTVLENGKAMAKKAYGKSSLEFGIPFSHNTILRLPYAEGREFISIAATLMEQEGLLSLDDKVRKYFSNLPAWSEPVTIHHLLNHRSGFDDEWAVLLLTQASMGNRLDVSQFLNLLYNQPAPGIEPGKGYMYCNSDFGLLRLILEKASGENLSVWMKRKIFAPLGMHSTRLHDNKDEVITSFAHEYNSAGRGKYIRWTNDKTSPGGNYHIATSAADLEKWANIHADPASFAFKSIQYLKKDAMLMPGKGKNYVFGIKEQEENGYTLITHQGVNDRPYLSRYPVKKYAVIVIGNTGANYVQLHQNIMNWLLGIKKPPFQNKKFTPAPVNYTTAELQQFAGRYFDTDTLGFESFTKVRKNLLQLVVHNDSLKWQLDSHTLIPLEQVAPNVFKDAEYEAYLEFEWPQNKNDPVRINTHVYPQNKVYHHVKDNSALWMPSKEELHSFAGKYYSRHLDFYWTLAVSKEGRLMIKRPTIADTELTPETKDVFTVIVDKYPGSSFEVFAIFHRDAASQITHFTVSDPRLMHHRFDKQQ